MRKNHIRLQAFTLLEVMVALLITAILSTFIFAVFNTFNRLIQQQQTRKAVQHEFDLLCYRIRTDCYQAEQIHVDAPQKLSLHDSTGAIVYQFEENQVCRTQYDLRTDTFYLRTEPLEYTLVPQQNEEPQGLVQQLHIRLQMNQKMLTLPIRKVYSAKQLIENQQKQ